MKYSIVIPTYNHCDDLLKPCIETILKYSNVADIEIVVSANGCTDNTFAYLGALKEKFIYLGLNDNLKIAWSAEPLGYAGATNAGIKLATTDYIVLLNNDVLILEQPRNQWLQLLERPFHTNPKCGITCVIKGMSEPAGREFAVFFCVMIHRKVFDKIGLVSMDYGVGGGEDTEFCIEAEKAGFEVCEAVEKTWAPDAQLYTGYFPIYHKGEGTMHDPTLVPEWNDIFETNSITLAKKYNPKWYQWRISNNSERAVFFKGDFIFPREATRYGFAAKNLNGNKVLEIGCSSGFGLQFLPDTVDYLGIDYDQQVITAAKDQQWRANAKFECRDIIQMLSGNNIKEHYDTIIAFETIEHLKNGLDVVENLKTYCNKLIITVPYNENPGQFSAHHLTHNLTPDKFKDFQEIGLIDVDGKIVDRSTALPNIEYNLLMVWESTIKAQGDYRTDLRWLQEQHAEIYREVIEDNGYGIKVDDIANKNVIDIGANIGAFSLLAGYLGANRVIAVEPISSTFESLTKNIARSNLTNIVPIKNIVTDKSGDKFKISLNENSGHNSMYNVQDNFETVDTISLADVMKTVTGNDLVLKLDCEGAEYDIILNATEEQMARVSHLIVEIHAELHPVYKGFEILNDKLKAFGFKQIDAKQIFTWMIDQAGNMIEGTMKPIPYRVEMWKK